MTAIDERLRAGLQDLVDRIDVSVDLDGLRRGAQRRRARRRARFAGSGVLTVVLAVTGVAVVGGGRDEHASGPGISGPVIAGVQLGYLPAGTRIYYGPAVTGGVGVGLPGVITTQTAFDLPDARLTPLFVYVHRGYGGAPLSSYTDAGKGVTEGITIDGKRMLERTEASGGVVSRDLWWQPDDHTLVDLQMSSRVDGEAARLLRSIGAGLSVVDASKVLRDVRAIGVPDEVWRMAQELALSLATPHPALTVHWIETTYGRWSTHENPGVRLFAGADAQTVYVVDLGGTDELTCSSCSASAGAALPHGRFVVGVRGTDGGMQLSFAVQEKDPYLRQVGSESYAGVLAPVERAPSAAPASPAPAFPTADAVAYAQSGITPRIDLASTQSDAACARFDAQDGAVYEDVVPGGTDTPTEAGAHQAVQVALEKLGSQPIFLPGSAVTVTPLLLTDPAATVPAHRELVYLVNLTGISDISTAGVPGGPTPLVSGEELAVTPDGKVVLSRLC